MQFNPEDGKNFGPHCRNCHKGSSDCGACHSPYGYNTVNGKSYRAYTSSAQDAANNDYPINSRPGLSTYFANNQYRNERGFADGWPVDWDTTSAAVSATCSNDGFSWPHRTMGYMMLKDELFGLDRDGTVVGVGGTKVVYINDPSNPSTWTTEAIAAHDLDSVCLDCHNPNIWNASSYSSHNPANGIYDDQLLLRGLP